MAEISEQGFKIPDYSDTADIPELVRDNVGNAEAIISAIRTNFSNMSSYMQSIEMTIQVMNRTLGSMSDMLDNINGIVEEEIA